MQSSNRLALPLTLIVAVSPSNGIGAKGTLPWQLAREMAYFKHVTSFFPAMSHGRGQGKTEGKNAVIMGRNTWESIPPRFRPLKGRVNIVISRSASAAELGIDKAEDTHLFASPNAAMAYLRQRASPGSPTSASPTSDSTLGRVFLIGGAQLYVQALARMAQIARAPVDNQGTQIEGAHDAATEDEASWADALDTLLITRILAPDFAQCDAFLPEFRTRAQVERGREEMLLVHSATDVDSPQNAEGKRGNTTDASAASTSSTDTTSTSTPSDSRRPGSTTMPLAQKVWARAPSQALASFTGLDPRARGDNNSGTLRGSAQEDGSAGTSTPAATATIPGIVSLDAVQEEGGVKYVFEMWTRVKGQNGDASA